MILLNQDQSRIVDYTKQQIQAFLEELDDFYPFGAEIKTDGALVPLSVPVEEADLSIQSIITSLEQNVADNLLSKSIRLGAVAISVVVPEGGLQFDGVQIRFYQPDTEPRFINLKYRKTDAGVEFF